MSSEWAPCTTECLNSRAPVVVFAASRLVPPSPHLQVLEQASREEQLAFLNESDPHRAVEMIIQLSQGGAYEQCYCFSLSRLHLKCSDASVIVTQCMFSALSTTVCCNATP
jgi:hypothetical protein